MTAPVLSRPEVPATRPWTLAETLAVLEARRLVLDETSRGLRVRHRHAHDLPGLDEALSAYASAVRVWMHLGGASAHVAAPWRADGWDAPTRLFAAWFGLVFEPPATPAALRPGETVMDWRRFRLALADRLTLGPLAPGADDVRDVLVRLFVRFGLHEGIAIPVPRFARAA